MPVHIDCQLISYGFYPAGGGEVFARVDPSMKRNAPLLLMDRGTLSYKTFVMIHSKSENACNKINERLRPDLKCNPVEVLANGKGLPVLSAFYKYTNFSEMINVYHQKDIPRTVSAFTTLVDEYQKSSAPVEEHLADQLILPLALIGGGTYKAISLSKHSKHFETNVTIIHMFSGPRIYVSQVVDGYEVRVV
jgi:RNA 3'-terminal phosphate cyclase (ATP)